MIKHIPGFTSANRSSELESGPYVVGEQVYRSEDGSTTATLTEVCSLHSSIPCAADLLVVLSDGSVLFRDFMQLADGSWRDSNGLVSEELRDLLPPELGQFTRSGPRVRRSLTVESGVFHWTS